MRVPEALERLPQRNENPSPGPPTLFRKLNRNVAVNSVMLLAIGAETHVPEEFGEPSCTRRRRV